MRSTDPLATDHEPKVLPWLMVLKLPLDGLLNVISILEDPWIVPSCFCGLAICLTKG